MKKIKGCILSIGAVFIALLLISSATAIPQTQSEPLNNYIEKQEESISLYPLININLEEFAQLFSDYYSSEEFINFITDSQTETLISQLMDIAPTLLEYLRNEINEKSNEINQESANLKVNEESRNLFKSSVSDENIITTLKSQNRNLFKSSVLEENIITTLKSQDLNMQVSEPLQGINAEFYVMARELKAIYVSTQFVTIKNTVYYQLLNAGYDLGDDSERALSVCADLITIGCFLQLLPVELLNIDYKLTESTAITKSALIALVPSVVLVYSKSPFTTLEGLSDILETMVETYFNDDFNLFDSTVISDRSYDCGCGVQSNDYWWIPGKVVICAILLVVFIITFPFAMILAFWMAIVGTVWTPIFTLIILLIYIAYMEITSLLECVWMEPFY